MGRADVLIAGDRIARIAPDLSNWCALPDVEVSDLEGKILAPGFIDLHVHILGGGGGGGFTTRGPELFLSEITSAGTTTVVGVIGTDGVTRDLTALLAKAHALQSEGITTYIWSGAYFYPPPTLTGAVWRDLVLVDKVLGVGEVAISDVRSTEPTPQELTRLAAEVRMGGRIAGKPGLLHLHVGPGKAGLKPLFEVCERSEVPIAQLFPTHLNRSRVLLEEAAAFAKAGGNIDLTASFTPARGLPASVPAAEALACLRKEGVPLERVTLSTDGNGIFTLPGARDFIRWPLSALHEQLRAAVVERNLPLSSALATVTENPAKVLGLHPDKGSLVAGADADLVVFHKDLRIDAVYARGRKMVEGGKAVVFGRFEPGEREGDGRGLG
ncbi:MAG: beta-aspartyl-peptidase [Candidatus Tectomicrobia bacterium]|nr:beta-aspartyl-peptidase [Candidatus Tectomicrobia bacterium]